MGACEKTMTLDGCLSFEQVKEIFKDRQEQDRYDYGNDSYNGSFTTFNGIKNCLRTFNSYNEAQSYILDNSEKWGYALAVNYMETNGVKKWLVGGWAAE